MEEGATSHGMWAASEAGVWEGADSPWSPQEKPAPVALCAEPSESHFGLLRSRAEDDTRGVLTSHQVGGHLL